MPATHKDMIDKTALSRFIEEQFEGTDLFLVDVTVSPDNEIKVEIDSDEPLDLDTCIELTRKIEGAFDRDVEDYELEVGTAGLTSPFKTVRQYQKNIGNPVEVLTADGRKLKGTLTDADAEGFEIEMEHKVRKEGQKKPVLETVHERLPYGAVKQAMYLLEF